MTIDEAIARERQMAETHKNDIVPKENYHNMPWIDKNNEARKRSAEYHEQLVEWLEELKEYKENQHRSLRHMYEKGYNKAIYDFVEELKDYFVIPHDVRVIEMKAERLKAGGK